jgi:hypothetical protein
MTTTGGATAYYNTWAPPRGTAEELEEYELLLPERFESDPSVSRTGQAYSEKTGSRCAVAGVAQPPAKFGFIAGTVDQFADDSPHDQDQVATCDHIT